MKAALVLSLFLFAGTALANFSPKESSSLISKTTRLQCTDFTGDWSGECKVVHSNNGSYTFTGSFSLATISCDLLHVNGDDYPLNGVTNVMSSSNKDFKLKITETSWNDPIKKESVLVKVTTKNTPFDESTKLWNMEAVGKMSLDNGKLIYSSEKKWVGLHLEETTNCTMIRK